MRALWSLPPVKVEDAADTRIGADITCGEKGSVGWYKIVPIVQVIGGLVMNDSSLSQGCSQCS